VANRFSAASQGRRFLFRSAAAFVSARLGIASIPAISPVQFNYALASFKPSPSGGLIIAGSYVPKTTAQLSTLRSRAGDRLKTVELDVGKLLESRTMSESEINRALDVAEHFLSQGQDVLVMTSRKLIVGANGAESLDIGGTIARALVLFLQRLKVRPRYLIAKV
jgi:uncharacterized protein YgbK (DUF1537 family)